MSNKSLQLDTNNLLYGSKVIRWLGLQALQEVELRLETWTSVREALTVLLDATEDERNQLVVDIAKLRKSHQLQECALQACHEALQVYNSVLPVVDNPHQALQHVTQCSAQAVLSVKPLVCQSAFQQSQAGPESSPVYIAAAEIHPFSMPGRAHRLLSALCARQRSQACMVNVACNCLDAVASAC